MKYLSTRGKDSCNSSAEAIIKGLASDRGLFVPENMPKLPFAIEEIKDKDYLSIAAAVLGAFFPDYTEEEIMNCVRSAYDEKFEDRSIAPLVKVGDVNILELFHGKTAAFKDMALSILPYLLTTAIKKLGEKDKVVILTATSGDTGKAALEGFADVDGTEILVFYPKEGVSQVQEKQMISQEGDNTHVFSIRGNFDNAQSGVKEIFNDEALKVRLGEKGIKLSSANSINIGRLVPQVAYYVWAYAQMIKNDEISLGEEVNVVVPTGNFGNILAAYYAKMMGIPFGKFICASNDNKVLTDFINTGEYNIDRDFYLTISPSMDILISSNLERLLYYILDNNGEEVAKLMTSLEKEKVYKLSDDSKAKLSEFFGGYADERSTKEVIGRVYGEKNYLLDTHTAVAYKVYEDYKKETGDSRATIIASTASPYKFSENVAKSIGLEECEDGFESLEKLSEATGVKVPKGLQGLRGKKILHDKTIDVEDMKNTVEGLF